MTGRSTMFGPFVPPDGGYGPDVAPLAPYPYQAILDAIGAAVEVQADGTIKISVTDFLATFSGHRDFELACDALLDKILLDFREHMTRKIAESIG